jgi:Zn finger protein HypA/HybF involved in hydrogenase expression
MKTELTIKKVKCTQDMIGQDILIPGNEKSLKSLKSLPYAKDMISNIKYKQDHNIKRHGLFWACVGLVSENTGKADYEIEEKVKIDCRWIKGYITYPDKNGKNRVNVITKSISFFSMNLEDANNFYSKAFDVLASYIGVETNVMIEEAKLRMKGKYYCILCGKQGIQKHHKFSQSKVNIAKYGRELIDAEFNTEWLCPDCHSSHNKIPKELNWSEARFVKEAKSRGYLQNTKDDLINTFEGEEVKNENNG